MSKQLLIQYSKYSEKRRYICLVAVEHSGPLSLLADLARIHNRTVPADSFLYSKGSFVPSLIPEESFVILTGSKIKMENTSKPITITFLPELIIVDLYVIIGSRRNCTHLKTLDAKGNRCVHENNP